MNHKKIYIEAGAADGIDQSRSLHFINRDEYLGILVEPTPQTYQECIKNRSNENTLIYNCALVSFDYKLDYIDFYKNKTFNLMNSCIKENKEEFIEMIKVPAVTLQSILDKNNITEVENFYLDTEGYEIEVLKGIDFNKTKFKEIEIECHWKFINIDLEDEIKMHSDYLINFNYFLDEVITDVGHPKLIFKLNEKS